MKFRVLFSSLTVQKIEHLQVWHNRNKMDKTKPLAACFLSIQWHTSIPCDIALAFLLTLMSCRGDFSGFVKDVNEQAQELSFSKDYFLSAALINLGEVQLLLSILMSFECVFVTVFISLKVCGHVMRQMLKPSLGGKAQAHSGTY